MRYFTKPASSSPGAPVPAQLGFSPNGSEKASRMVRLYLQLNPEHVAVSNDFWNAFNCVSRKAVFKALAEGPFSDLLPMARFYYARRSHLYFARSRLRDDDSDVDSADGCQQGDPLGPFWFALALHSVLLRVQEAHASVRIVAYLDDVTLLGPSEVVAAAYKDLRTWAEEDCTLFSNLDKSVAYSPQGSLAGLPEGLKGAAPGPRLRGFVYLGTAIGDPSWCSAHLARELTKQAAHLSCLGMVKDTGHLHTAKQVKLLILRFCAASKPGFWLRVAPPSEARQAAEAHDALIEEAVTRITGARGVEPKRLRRAIRQSQQPKRQGGLGFTSAIASRDAAFCASFSDCWLEMRRLWPEFAAIDLERDATPPSDVAALREARQRLLDMETSVRRDDTLARTTIVDRNKFGENEYEFRPGTLPPAGKLPTLADMADPECKHLRKAQRKFMQIVHRHEWLRLKRDCDRLTGTDEWRESIRLVSASQQYAMAFLNAIPTTHETTIPSDLLHIILQRQLGLPLTCVGKGQYSPGLGRFVDVYGDALANRQSAAQSRHNYLNAAWAGAWRAAFTGVEVPTDDSNYNDYSRGAKPDLVAYFAGRFRHHLLGEVKLVSPISCGKDASESDLKHRRAMRIGLGGTEQYYREKILGRKHCERGATPKPAHYAFALSKGHQVVAMIHEVFGAWSDDTADLLDRLGEIREGRLDREFHSASWSERSFHSFYAGRISTALHLGVAEMIRVGAGFVAGGPFRDARGMSGKRRYHKRRRGNAN